MTRPIREEDLHAWVDGVLDPLRRPEVERYLAANPQEAARVASYTRDRAALREVFAAASRAPVPPQLDVTRLVEAQLRQGQRTRRRMLWAMAAAASVALAVGGGAGWWARRPPSLDRSAEAMAVLLRQGAASWRVFAADPNRPVELTADQRELLARWLSNRLQRKVAPPDLSDAGFRLLGGRLIATERGAPAALFVYDDAERRRLAVVVRPMAPELHVRNTDVEEGSLRGCAWIAQGLGVALAAPLTDAELDRLATLVRQQMPA